MKLIVVVSLAVAWGAAAAAGESMDLTGQWHLRLDPGDDGLRAGWARAPIESNERIALPNTTDRAGFGFALDPATMQHAAPFPVTTRFPGVKEPTRADEHGYLVRQRLYVGPAWYEREIDIPEGWKGRSIALRLERAIWRTDAWIDGRHAGSEDSLVAEHRHELGELAPGRHRLTVRVDNRMIYNLSTVTHAYGPETQTRWNGIVGAIALEAAGPVSIRRVAAYPAADRKSVRVVLHVVNVTGAPAAGTVKARLVGERDALAADGETTIECAPGRSAHELVLRLEAPARAWDEFDPAGYRIVARLERDGATASEATTAFGFRHIERDGMAMRLNGRPVFLRGTLDCAVYPGTGHPPMTVSEWERTFTVVKEHGFNHVRFHTWCPPEAAFEAADRRGVYLQAEAPAWVDDWGTNTITKPLGIGRDPQVTAFLEAELRRMSEAYGNHPSFVLCAIGNEFGMQSTDWDRVNAMVAGIKSADPRRLYTGCGARKNLPADDYWFTHHTGASTRGVGPANTEWDFAKAAAGSPVPVIAHETGQRPVFPDYAQLLPKFSGPLLPLNLDRYRRDLIASGLSSQAKDFVRASAQFQLVQYKAEHEAMLRTRGYAGYQLLMLNDFTGQSEALVGILDPFWDTKGIVSPAEIRAWNAPTVVLARFPKYVWTADETFAAKLEVAHFGAADLPRTRVTWSLKTHDDRTIAEGEQRSKPIPAGGVSELGELSIPLDRVREPMALVLSVRLGAARNTWNLWVYPPAADEPEPAGVVVVRQLDERAHQALFEGKKVLLLAHGLKNPHAATTGFESVYWSAGWWGNAFSSLGVLCDPKHPALAAFPNEGWSDWQWRDLCQGATTFNLNGAPVGFRPIVQPVPDFHYNTLLGQVFEAKVEKGALLVCGYDLSSNLDKRPAARQFRRSLMRYVGSADFRPAVELRWSWVEQRCGQAGLRRLGAKVVRVDSEDRANGNVAQNVLDGDASTFWHTRWQPQNDPMPHELVIDLGKPMVLRGITCLPRQDQSNGRIARAEVYAALKLDGWVEPDAEIRGEDSRQWQTIRFAQPVTARYLRLVVKSEVDGQPFAALAELDILPAD